ncbi:hypothetical protein ACJJTC_018057 [Scirpophaga incertulas]
MKITVKKLQGGECSLEVLPTTSILEIKKQVSEKLGIPPEDQKLLLLGRTLADEQRVQSYPTIKEGSKLNLVVKKSDNLQTLLVKHYKQSGMSDSDANTTVNKILKNMQEKFDRLSWDDIERLCYDCLLEERGETRQSAPHDRDREDTFSL